MLQVSQVKENIRISSFKPVEHLIVQRKPTVMARDAYVVKENSSQDMHLGCQLLNDNGLSLARLLTGFINILNKLNKSQTVPLSGMSRKTFFFSGAVWVNCINILLCTCKDIFQTRHVTCSD